MREGQSEERITDVKDATSGKFGLRLSLHPAQLKLANVRLPLVVSSIRS